MIKRISKIFLGMILLSTAFSGLLLEPNGTTDAVTPKQMIYVGGQGSNNYTTIQEAIDVANEGDTVFIYGNSSPYYENLIIYKAIALLGEDRNTTIIDGGEIDDVLYICSDSVLISGLTIRNSGLGSYDKSGITICSNYTTITSNIIISNKGHGVNILNSCHNIVNQNIISSNYWAGIHIEASENTLITENHIFDNDYGITLSSPFTSSTNSNIINNNIIQNNINDGILLYYSHYNSISNNTIESNGQVGIILGGSSQNNSIIANTITSNDYAGIMLYTSSNYNYLFHNNFLGNTQNAYDECHNYWDNDYPSGGNYWSDYAGIDGDGDGIGDVIYYLPGGGNQDKYPLIKPWGIQILSERLYEGWNLISITADNSWTAESLGKNISGCNLVLLYNGSTQEFMTHVVGNPYDDFPIVDGMGYFIRVSADTMFDYGGLSIPSVNVTVYEGWNTMGWFHEYPTTAQSLGETVDASLVLAFNATTQDFMTYVMNSGYDNFIITRGMAVFIQASTPGWWQGEG